MSSPSQPVAAVALARQLASTLPATQPGATLPCPVCPANVDAANLEFHLSKAHADRLQDPGGALRITGVDKRSFFATIGLLIAWAVAAVVAFSVIGVALTNTSVAILAVSLVVCASVPTAAAAGAFKARLELDGDQLRLRWLLGSRAVPLPATIEAGVALDSEMKSTGVSAVDGAAKDVAGAYIRLSGGGVTITVATTEAPELGERWAASGWTRGDEIRRWDVTVDRPAFVALELHLAARGQLTARTG